MGRTFEALSHSRSIRVVAEDEMAIPPTAIVPDFLPQSDAVTKYDADSDVDNDQATEDTALLDEFLKDNNEVPFIEVGGPRGSNPLYGPSIDQPTPVPNPSPLRFESAPPVVEKAEGIASVAFYPLPERAPPDACNVAAGLIAYHKPDHQSSGQYRGLMAGIAAQHPSAGCPLLIFTTIGHPIESTTTILNLAVTRARNANKRILVIEANHERPLIASRLGIAAMPGMRELLNRSIPMSVALHPSAQANLFALPPGDADLPVPHEAEARLPSVIEHLRKRFDWLLVNGPEWGGAGATEWASLGDAVYLVVHQEQWDKPEVEAAHEAIVKSGAKLRGYVTLR